MFSSRRGGLGPGFSVLSLVKRRTPSNELLPGCSKTRKDDGGPTGAGASLKSSRAFPADLRRPNAMGNLGMEERMGRRGPGLEIGLGREGGRRFVACDRWPGIS